LQSSVKIGRRPFCRTFSRPRHSVPRGFLTSRKWSLDRWLVGSLARWKEDPKQKMMRSPHPSSHRETIHVFGPRTRPLGSLEALLISLQTSRTNKSLQQKKYFRIPPHQSLGKQSSSALLQHIRDAGSNHSKETD